MGTEPLLAGIDVGTTNIKAILFTPAGQTVAEASVPTPTHYPRPTWAYYEPEEIWQATIQALRRVTCQVADPQQIVSIAATSMGEAATPLDAQGQPTYEAIAWFDQRTQPQVEWLAQSRALGSSERASAELFPGDYYLVVSDEAGVPTRYALCLAIGNDCTLPAPPASAP